MKITTKYILRSIVFNSFLMLFVLSSLFALFDLIAEFKNIGTYNYSFLSVLIFVALKIPIYINSTLVLAISMGVIVALGSLVDSKFTIILQSSGVTKKDLIKQVIFITFFISLILTILGELSANFSEVSSKNYKNSQLGRFISSKQVSNFWVIEGSSIYHFDKNLDGRTIQGFTKYDFDNKDLVSIHSSDKAIVDQNKLLIAPGEKLTLGQDGKFRTFEKQPSESEQISYFLDSDVIANLELKPWDLDLVDLIKQINYLQDSGVNSTSFVIDLYTRILKPFLTLVLVYIAIPFLLSYNRTMSIGNRIFFGFVLGLTSKILIDMSNIISLRYDLNHLFFAISPILILLTLGFLLNFKFSKV